MGNRNDIPASDENLVEMHRKARKKKRNRLIITLVITIAVVLVAVIAAIILLQNRVADSVSSSEDEVQSAEVTTGSISTTVSGSGTLSDEDVESIDVPSSLEIVDFYVEEGDTVSEGDLIATVTNASLLTAMSDAQETLDTLDEELEDAAGDEVSSTISASVSGRVKYIAVSSGDDVTTVMYDSGALMLLSLDGYMAVDVETDSLTASDSVTVTDSDGTEYSGTVESVSDGTATVLITDNGSEYGDTVTVSTSATSSSGVTTYTAEVTIAKTEDMLSGMSASVTITIEGVDDALLIPVDALHQTSSTAYVYTEYDEGTGEFSGMVEVTTGLSNSSYVEITDGLSEGDTVYYTESSDDSSDFSMDFGTMDMDSMDFQGGMSGGDRSDSTGGDMGGMPGGN